MAVYTHVASETLEAFLANFDVGSLRSFKGIAEGVENSNYLVETDQSRFILTLYEKRVDPEDLPFFMALLDHVAERGSPVPRAIRNRKGEQLHDLCGRKACLIEFLEGVSVSHPTPAQACSAGEALGRLHEACAGFTGVRKNALDLDGWRGLAQKTGAGFAEISTDLSAMVSAELEWLGAEWPSSLPRGTIHADLFPDNVLMIGDDVTGVIDFYFACTDLLAYDIAITHAAWCFSADGKEFYPDISAALLSGYERQRPLSPEEREALPTLMRGAALRFLLTRAYDWINTPPGALVQRKDPMAFANRLIFYRNPDNRIILGQKKQGADMRSDNRP